MAETALYDPVVVEPKLTDLKVRELTSFGRESAKLDYKVELDPSDTIHKVGLAKDIMAMANTAGGYVVVGVDDTGNVVGCDATLAARLDESVIRSQVAGYTSARIPLFVDNRIIYQGKRLVVITALPMINTLVVAETDGNIPKRSAAFRKGDVLVRHGSASERWNQADVDFLLRRIMATRKEEWIREFGNDIRTLASIAINSPKLIGPETYDLPPEDFQKLVIDLLRQPNG